MVKPSSTVQLIDPSQAALWLDKRYRHQRSISPDQVAHLAKAMADDNFSPVSIIMFSVVNGEMHLINGQQTLNAIIKSGVSQSLPVMYYEVADESEEAKLYSRIDRQRKRNFSDSVRATGICAEVSMTPTMIAKTASALRYVKGGFGTIRGYARSVSDDDLLEWIPFWAWETRAIYNAITPCGSSDRSLIVQVPVFSVALMTIRYKPDRAREFWRQVAQDDGMERGDPRKSLRNWLLSLKRRRADASKQVDYPEISRGVAFAWNTWYAGKSLMNMPRRISVDKIKIAGTSFNGAQGDDFLPIYPSPNIEQARLLETA